MTMTDTERLEAAIEADLAAFGRLVRAGVEFDPENPRMRAMMERLLTNLRRLEESGSVSLPAVWQAQARFIERVLADAAAMDTKT